jgi:hypothetical protein
MRLAAAALAVPATAAGSIALAGRADAQVVTAAPPILRGQNVYAPEGDPSLIDHIVGAMTYFGDTNYTLSRPSIDWGDGATTGGSTPPGYVTGAHLYREAGTYTVKVTVTATPVKPVGTGTSDGSVILTVQSTAQIREVNVTLHGTGSAANPVIVPGGAYSGHIAGGHDVSQVVSRSDYSAVIDWNDGHVDAACTSCIAGDVAAASAATTPSTAVTINWGDGNTTPGTVAKNGTVSGSHTYTDEGTYTITLTASPAVALAMAIAGPPWSDAAKVTVADSALTATSVASPSVTGTVNKALTATLAHASDANPGATLNDLSATIDWGDGSAVSVATLVAGSGGVDAGGTHTYTTTGVKHGVVHFVDDGGQLAQAPFTVTVATPPAGVTVAAPPASGVLGVTSTPAPTTTASAPVKVPNTGSDLPLAPGLLLIGLGGVVAAMAAASVGEALAEEPWG